MALPSSVQRLGRDVEEALMSMGVPLAATAVRSTSLSLIRELLHRSDMLAVLPPLMLAGDLLRGSVRVVPIDVPTPPRPAGLITLRHRPCTPGTEALTGAVTAEIARLRELGVLG